ncbi:MAG: SurA N-terminal domain-containing protein [Patescibacteria group bacterium]|nr:SurA N-terminal domain-containing protein [Patescibacteria group bacterium]
MSFRTSLISFGVMMAIGVSGYALSVNGWYPVAVVNWHVISQYTLEQNLSTAYVYYHNALALSGGDPATLDTPAAAANLRRAVLDDAISEELIRDELAREMSAGDLQTVAEKKVDQVLQDQSQVSEGVEKLYGLTLDQFKARVLLPQAYQEVLSGRMLLQGQDFNTWLAQARKSAGVIILTPGFSWDGSGVTAK